MKAVRKEVLKRFLTDLDFYSKGNLQIRDKDARLVPFIMNPAQQKVHAILADQYKSKRFVRAIVLKARQEGVSTYVAARNFRRIHLLQNQEALIVAHEKEPAQKLFAIYDRFLSHLPPEMQPMTRYVSKQTQLVLDNPDDKTRATNPGLGNVLSIETANDTSAGRGSTINLIHASEMAFWEKPEGTWNSMMQSVPDKNSEVIIESTANGVGNFFHQFWDAAVAGENDFVPIFLPWFIDPSYSMPLNKELKDYVTDTLTNDEKKWVTEGIPYEGTMYRLSLEQIAWRRSTIRNKTAGSEEQFRQEYPATPDEAFLVSGNAFFDQFKLVEYGAEAKPPLLRANLEKLRSGGIIAREAERGYLRMYLKPSQKLRKEDKDPIYVIGADTASGRQVAAQKVSVGDDDERGGRDFSSADVFDAANRRFVAQLHGRMAPEIFAQNLQRLGYYYSNPRRDGTRDPALIGVEKNHSSGETVLRVLQQFYRYPRLYFSRQINRRRETVKEVLGWQTSVETRMPMLDELAAAIREDTVWLPNKDTIREMRTFVRGEDGKPAAQEGAHDDRVISSAIALQLARSQSLAPPKNFNQTEQAERGSSPTGLFDYG